MPLDPQEAGGAASHRSPAALDLVGGGALGLGSVLLRGVDLVVEMALAAVTALATEPLHQTMAAGLRRVGQSFTNRMKAFNAWLHGLVRRETPMKRR